MLPLLNYASDGHEKNIREAITTLSDQFKLSDVERQQLVPSGKQNLIDNRVHWARTFLAKAGAIRKTRRAHFEITDRGRQLLATHPSRIDVKTLRQFPEFRDFQSSKNSGDELQPASSETSDVVPVTPEEAISRAEKDINRDLGAQLIERIGEMTPSFFEQLVIDLIVAMGYGGSREIVAQRIGKSGDEGIDGVVNEDPLGLDIVYIQAKRYKAENVIGRERIQQFSGALVGQGATKGVFVTTSSFSRGAIEYAHRVPQRIILIDGNELANLMIRYGVGVRTERTVQIKRLDADYFDVDME